MKTSTKIFVVYGIVVIALQLIFLANSLIQYQRLKPLAIEMSKKLENTPIHHIEIDVSQASYPSIMPVMKMVTKRKFVLGANLKTSRISNDTLYIKALNDNISSYSSNVPELRSTTIIKKDGVEHRTIGNE